MHSTYNNLENNNLALKKTLEILCILNIVLDKEKIVKFSSFEYQKGNNMYIC